MTHHILARLGRAIRTAARVFQNERGATAIEYGLLAALIAIAAIQAMGALGGTTSQTLDMVEDAMANDDTGQTPIGPQ